MRRFAYPTGDLKVTRTRKSPINRASKEIPLRTARGSPRRIVRSSHTLSTRAGNYTYNRRFKHDSVELYKHLYRVKTNPYMTLYLFSIDSWSRYYNNDTFVLNLCWNVQKTTSCVTAELERILPRSLHVAINRYIKYRTSFIHPQQPPSRQFRCETWGHKGFIVLKFYTKSSSTWKKWFLNWKLNQVVYYIIYNYIIPPYILRPNQQSETMPHTTITLHKRAVQQQRTIEKMPKHGSSYLKDTESPSEIEKAYGTICRPSKCGPLLRTTRSDRYVL